MLATQLLDLLFLLQQHSFRFMILVHGSDIYVSTMHTIFGGGYFLPVRPNNNILYKP